MKICYLTWEYPPEINGGVAIYVSEIAKAMKKLGNDVFVITRTEYEDREGYEDGVYVVRVKSKKLKMFKLIREKLPRTLERLEYSWLVSKKLKEIVKNYGIDVVESCEAYSQGFWYYLFREKPPLIIKLHTPEGIIFHWNNEELNLDLKLLIQMEEFWILRARAIVSITENMKRLFSNLYQIELNQTPVIYNPLSISETSISLSRNSNIVLYVGRLEFRKGVHILLKAIPLVLKNFPEVEFVLIGKDCGMRWYIEKKIREYSFQDKVFIYDHLPREEVFTFYRRAKACVVPSLWENFPYTILEAMSFGLPVVASGAGGILELIKDRENGILFTPGSFLDLADKISLILRDEALASKLGLNAFRSVRELTAPPAIAERTLEVYRSVLKNV